jgi:hypothetical protein
MLAATQAAKIESAIAAVALTAGRAVAIDTTSGAGPVLKVSVPNNSADKILGVLLIDAGLDDGQHDAGRAVAVLTSGKVWVTPSETVAPGELAYADPTDGTLSKTSTDNILIGRWLGNGGTSTACILEVSIA